MNGICIGGLIPVALNLIILSMDVDMQVRNIAELCISYEVDLCTVCLTYPDCRSTMLCVCWFRLYNLPYLVLPDGEDTVLQAP